MSFLSSFRTARSLVAGVALAGVVVFTACGKDKTGPSGDVYTLVSIDGNTLPYSETDAMGTYTVKSGTLNLKPNGTYSFRAAVSYTFEDNTQNLTVGEDGTYEQDGNSFTMTSTHDVYGNDRHASTGDITTATLSGNTLTATSSEAVVTVFTKS